MPEKNNNIYIGHTGTCIGFSLNSFPRSIEKGSPVTRTDKIVSIFFLDLAGLLLPNDSSTYDRYIIVCVRQVFAKLSDGTRPQRGIHTYIHIHKAAASTRRSLILSFYVRIYLGEQEGGEEIDYESTNQSFRFLFPWVRQDLRQLFLFSGGREADSGS